MTLYGYVPGKDELLDLMLDALSADMPRGLAQGGRLARAAARWPRPTGRCRRAPWGGALSTARPPLGPGLMAKYEHELAAFDGAGLGDVERDAALSFLLASSRGRGRAAGAPRRAPTRSGGRPPARCSPRRRPRALPARRRVGAAAGEAHGSAHDPEHAYAFGLERVLDGSPR